MDYPIITPDQLRSYLVSLRLKAGYSQAEIGELIGISQQAYQNLESNPDRVSFGRILKILQMLKASLVIRDKNEATSFSVPTKRVKKKIIVKLKSSNVIESSQNQNKVDINTQKEDGINYHKEVLLRVPTGKKVEW